MRRHCCEAGLILVVVFLYSGKKSIKPLDFGGKKLGNRTEACRNYTSKSTNKYGIGVQQIKRLTYTSECTASYKLMAVIC